MSSLALLLHLSHRGICLRSFRCALGFCRNQHGLGRKSNIPRRRGGLLRHRADAGENPAKRRGLKNIGRRRCYRSSNRCLGSKADLSRRSIRILRCPRSSTTSVRFYRWVHRRRRSLPHGGIHLNGVRHRYADQLRQRDAWNLQLHGYLTFGKTRSRCANSYPSSRPRGLTFMARAMPGKS